MLETPFGRRLKRLFDCNDFAWTPPLAPWSPSRARRLRRLRAQGRRVMTRRLVQDKGRLSLVASTLAWPLVSGLKALLAARAAAKTGKPSAFFRRWWLQVGHNVRLAEQENARLGSGVPLSDAGLFITDGEHKALMEWMNRNGDPGRIDRKEAFERYCLEQGLPTPRLLAEGGGARARALWHGELPACDLFVKRSDAWGGSGACVLELVPGETQRWSCGGGPALAPGDLESWLAERYAGGPWVLQPRLGNASAWTAFSPSALCTVRIVTGRMSPEAAPEVVCAFMRFPRNAAAVDNLSSGGIASGVEPQTGVLGPAWGMEFAPREYPVHPVTGAVLAGATLPEWPALAALACRAHEPLGDLALVGWDVSLSTLGPILIEANTNWGVPMHVGLGATRYLEILEQPCWRRLWA